MLSRLLLLILLTLPPFLALAADPPPLDKVEREVIGWTASGSALLVRMTSRGEVMVDGEARDYWFELTEVYSTSDGELRARYQHGEAQGYVHPVYAEAKPAALEAKYLETAGLQYPHVSPQSPDRRFVVHVIEEADQPVGDEGAGECRWGRRVVLIDAEAATVSTRAKASAKARCDVALPGCCAPVKARRYWDPGSQRWAVTLEALDDARGWTLLQGDVAPQDDEGATKPLARRVAPPQAPEGNAAKALESSLGKARTGEVKGAMSEAKKAFDSSEKTPLDRARYAAVLMVGDQVKRATKELDRAIKAAEDWEALAEMADLFVDVDVDVANQLYVHALSHPSAKELEPAKTTPLYERLLDGLVAQGAWETVEEILGRFEEPSPAMKVARGALLLRREPLKAQELALDVLRADPGQCAAYGLLGRARLAKRFVTGEPIHDLTAAAHCDPRAGEPRYLVADLARAAGQAQMAEEWYRAYLAAAPPRRGDEIRQARLARTRQMLARLDAGGVALMSVSCRPLTGATLCTGSVVNTGKNPANDTSVQALTATGAVIGEATLTSIAPGESAPFGVRVEGKLPEGAVITAGRDEAERKRNETAPPL